MSSQSREDAILARIFAAIGTTNRVAVECGARDGVKGSNTHQWRAQGWRCVLFDRAPKAPIVHQVMLTAENIADTFAAYRVPASFDLLSIDVDGNDFHLWKALAGYTPRVVVIEYNASFAPHESVVMPYRAQHHWDKTNYYGASAAALVKLGREKGYVLVDYTPQLNLIFVRADVAVHLEDMALPPAAPYGYPSDGGRRWEAY